MGLSGIAFAWALVVLAGHGWSVRAAMRALTRTVNEAERWGADSNGFYGSEPLSKDMLGSVPIGMRAHDSDPWSSTVTMCILDYEARRADPAALPMFRFWTSKSQCGKSQPAGSVGFTTQMTLGKLRAHLERTEEDWVARHGSNRTGTAVWRPDGLVFHEARVGSTLVANMLQALPATVVYSESAPPVDALFRTEAWSDDTRVEALRVLVRAMGRVPGVERMFFKFQSAATGDAAAVLRAFPDSPFVFLKREPVEVMASLLGTYTDAMRRGADTGSVGQGRGGTPCTRTIRAPPEGMAAALGLASESELKSGGTEAYCAAHIGFVEVKATAALAEAQAQAKAGKRLGVGAAVDYKDLPAAVPGIVRTLFGVAVGQAEEASMLEAAKQYSKGTNKRSSNVDGDGAFKGDSEDKQRTAPPAMREAADRFVMPRRAELEAFTVEAAVALLPPSGPARAALPAPPTHDEVLKANEAAVRKQRSIPKEELGKSRPAGSLVGRGETDGTERVELADPAAGDAAPEAYPRLFPLPGILDAWSVDEPRVPASYGAFASLRVFDFSSEAEVKAARGFREAEVPFVARGVPNLLRLRDEWSDESLAASLPGKRHTEVSPTNHFMYYSRGARGGTSHPIVTRDESRSYAQWRKHAEEVEAAVLGGEAANRKTEHWYFLASSKHIKPGGVRPSGANGFIARDLRVFDGSRPDNGDDADVAKSDFFIVDPRAQRGIHCRFGQAGIVAEAHYDGGRNFIAMVRGRKRYVLSPPSECPHYNLLMDGPSARHSRTDWGDAEDYRRTLGSAKALEVVLEAGDALYVPSFWFHLPVSLETNIQCNTRSGSPPEGALDIEKCGFHIGTTEGQTRTPTPPTVAPPAADPTPAPKKAGP